MTSPRTTPSDDSGPPPWLTWTLIGLIVVAILAILWVVGCRRAHGAADWPSFIRFSPESGETPMVRDEFMVCAEYGTAVPTGYGAVHRAWHLELLRSIAERTACPS